MVLSAADPPSIDPTPIFELFRGSYGTELLTVAVAHFRLFDRLVNEPKSFDRLRRDLNLEVRPATVLITAQAYTDKLNAALEKCS